MVYWFNGLLSIEHDTFQWLNIYIMSGPTIPWDNSPPPLQCIDPSRTPYGGVAGGANEPIT